MNLRNEGEMFFFTLTLSFFFCGQAGLKPFSITLVEFSARNEVLSKSVWVGAEKR